MVVNRQQLALAELRGPCAATRTNARSRSPGSRFFLRAAWLPIVMNELALMAFAFVDLFDGSLLILFSTDHDLAPPLTGFVDLSSNLGERAASAAAIRRASSERSSSSSGVSPPPRRARTRRETAQHRLLSEYDGVSAKNARCRALRVTPAGVLFRG